MGSVVYDYVLYRNTGGSADETWTQITGYTYSNDGYLATVDVSAENIIAGSYYSFTYQAINAIGNSPKAPVLTVPVADVPDQPSPVVLVDHSYKSLIVHWGQSANKQGSVGVITGYLLYMDNGFHEDYTLVFDGTGLPDVRTYTAYGLVTGRPYRF